RRGPPLDELEDGVRPALADPLPPFPADRQRRQGDQQGEQEHAEVEEPRAPPAAGAVRDGGREWVLQANQYSSRHDLGRSGGLRAASPGGRRGPPPPRL